MDPQFYNTSKMKKIAEYVMVGETGSTDYDFGLFYVWGTINEILNSYYYDKQNLSRRAPEETHEIKRENLEIYFTDRVFKDYIELHLSKLIDKRTDSWSFYQLLQAIKIFKWADEKQISQEVDAFAKEIKGIQTIRHERIAHLSKKNKPHVLNAGFQLSDYQDVIENAVNLFDRFVDGETPYIIHFNILEEHNLRHILFP